VEDRDLLVQGALAYERPEPSAARQKPVGDDAEDCLSHRSEGHPEKSGQLALSGKALARPELAALDQVEQQLLDLRVQRELRAAPDQRGAGERRPAIERVVGQAGVELRRLIDPDIMRS
jgi:hypothetical protein